MDTKVTGTRMEIPLFIEHGRQGTYFTVPFSMPKNIASLSLAYHYERYSHQENAGQNGTFTSRHEINIIDLGLIAPDGTQVGASGSDKSNILISETTCTPGYRPCRLVPGEWKIIVGAYKVADQGVSVVYALEFTPKYRRMFKGDLHTHTIASDGVLTIAELAQHAQSNGLDYLAITDHNQMVSRDTLLEHMHLSLIPGIEWTHYQGHASFLGVDRPYDEPFLANSLEEVQARFRSAHARGAFISIDHPCDPVCPFLFDMFSLPFDCLEVWNGPMRGSNLQAIGLWQSLLVSGKKVPICGGSDYHRDSLLLFPGGPTTCVYAMSASPADILDALKCGHAFITYSANGPTLEMYAGEAILGDSVKFSEVRQLEFTARGLLTGDVVQVVTGNGATPVVKADTGGDMHGFYTMETAGFTRIEILRSFLPGLPLLPALISNPIYFDA
jgi:PHP domain